MPLSKREHIAILKRQLKIGQEIMRAAQQNYNTAALSVSEAQAALKELGAPDGQARKGKVVLTEDFKQELKANLTKQARPFIQKER